MTKSIVFIALATLVGATVLGCGDDRARVSVDVFGWLDDGSEEGQFVEGLPEFEGAQEVRVRITEPGTGQVIEQETIPIADGGTTLPELEGGQGLRMDFEVRGTTGTVASGATPTFDFDGDPGAYRGFRVMISAIDAFAPVGSVLRIGGVDTLVQSALDGRQLGEQQLGRVGHTAHPTESGEILIVGGARLSGAYESASHPSVAEVFGDIQLFDPATGYFTELAGTNEAIDAGATGQDRLTEPRGFHTVTPLGNDQFLVVGGYRLVGEVARAARSVELINLNAAPGERVTTLAGLELNSPRGLHTATRRPSDGKVVVAGGLGNDNDEVRDTIEILDPSTETNEGTTTMSDARVGHAAVLLGDDATVWLVGGHDGQSVLSSTSTVDGAQVSPGPTLNRARYGAAAVGLGVENNDQIAIIGGFTSRDSGATGSYELGNPLRSSSIASGGSWSIDRARGDAYVHRLPYSGDLLVVGGADPSREILADVERLTVHRDRIPPLSSAASQNEMVQDRAGFAAVPVSNGRLMLVGGASGSGQHWATAEYFNPFNPVQ